MPGVIETGLEPSAQELKNHLYQIGMGCQLFDDIVDLEADVREHHYNYVWSQIFYRADGRVRQELQYAFTQTVTDQSLSNLHGAFPHIIADVAAEGQRMLEDGLNDLLREEHHGLTAPLASFLIRRIGADHFLQGTTTA